MKIQLKSKYLLCIVSLICFGCDEFVDIGPPRTELVRQSVYLEDATAEAAIADMYHTLKIGFASGGEQGVSALAALSSDELILVPNGSPPHQEFYNNELLANNFILNKFWRSFYNTIYKSNAAIEGISGSEGGLSHRGQLLGEAKFIRAFCYFYLVNFWGGVPLATTTDYVKNSSLSRALITDVYDLVIADLLEAQELLTADYSYSNHERTRVNKGAATALLARAYLYREDWSSAEMEATKVINNTGLYSLTGDLNLAFRTSASEVIFQLWDNQYPSEALTFLVHPFYNGPGFGSLRVNLIDIFEPEDLRYSNWINSLEAGGTTFYGATKYKYSDPPRDQTTVLRLAELYLIRAEARAHQNKVAEAIDDLNVIRNRAGLANASATTPEELLGKIMEERYRELFTEWGHRWLDLKRTGRAGEVLAPIKSAWNGGDVLYPIPESQIISSPNISQNPG